MYPLADYVSVSSHEYNGSNGSIAKSIEQEILLGKKLRKRKPRPRETEYKLVDVYSKKSGCSRPKRKVYSTPSTPKRRAPKKCQARLLQLAVPSKRHLLETWRKNAHILPNYALDRLKQIVLDQIPIVPISDAVYCFQRQKRYSKKKSSKTKRKLGTSRPIITKGVSNFCEKFSSRILKKLSRPLNLTLSPYLECLSEVIYKEITEILKCHDERIKAKRKHKAFQIDVSKKIAVWIDGVLQDTNEKIIQEDLRELEEQEGPVWDFLDDVVENSLDICVPRIKYEDISLPFGIVYETPSEDEDSEVSVSSTENQDDQLQTDEMFISNDILHPLLDKIPYPTDDQQSSMDDQNAIIDSTDIVTLTLNDIQSAVFDQINATDPTYIVCSILNDIQSSVVDQNSTGDSTDVVTSIQGDTQSLVDDQITISDSQSISTSVPNDRQSLEYDQNIAENSTDAGYIASVSEPDEKVNVTSNVISNENQALEGIKSAGGVYGNLNIKNNIDEVPSTALSNDDNVSNKKESITDDKINNEEINADVFEDSNDTNTVFSNTNALNNEIEDHDYNGTDAEFDGNLENSNDNIDNTSKHVVIRQLKSHENTSYTGLNELTDKALVPYGEIQLDPKITFSLPNLNLLSDADEKWPDKSSIFKFNESFSLRKSNMSLKSISECDASMLTKQDTDKNESHSDKNIQSEEILTRVTSFKNQDIECQTNASKIAEYQLPPTSTEIGFDKEKSDKTGQGKAKQINKKQQDKTQSLTQKPQHSTTRPKPKYDWKVNLKTAPSWVKMALSNTNDLPQFRKSPRRLNEDDILKRRMHIENTLAHLEMWISWLHKIRRQINVLENRRGRICTCLKCKARVDYRLLKSKAIVINNMHLDIVHKIHRLRRELTCLGNNNTVEVEMASRRQCICAVKNNKDMQKLKNTGLP